VAFAACPPTALLATHGKRFSASRWRRDLLRPKWQTAHIDNAQMATQLLTDNFYSPEQHLLTTSPSKK